MNRRISRNLLTRQGESSFGPQLTRPTLTPQKYAHDACEFSNWENTSRTCRVSHVIRESHFSSKSKCRSKYFMPDSIASSWKKHMQIRVQIRVRILKCFMQSFGYPHITHTVDVSSSRFFKRSIIISFYYQTFP